jgi:phage tail sheath protein FI
MPEYLAPGVYVEEVSFRSKSIEGVSTTTTGFVGPASYGPVDLVPEIVTSLEEFERTYGSGEQLLFQNRAPSHNYLWHAVRAFFAEGGRRMYIARVFQPISAADDGCADATFPNGADPADQITVRARFPGRMGNMRVRFTLRLGPNALGEERVPNTQPAQVRRTVGALNDRDVVWIDREPGSPPSSPFEGAFYLAERSFDAALKDFRWTFTAGTRQIQLEADVNPDFRPGEFVVRKVSLTVTTIPAAEGVLPQTWSVDLDPRHQLYGAPDSLFDLFEVDPTNQSLALSLPIVVTRGAALEDGVAVLQALLASDPDLLVHLLSPIQPPGPLRRDSSDLERSLDLPLERGNDGQRPEAAFYEGRVDPATDRKTGLKIFEDLEDISIVAAPGSTFDYNGGYQDNARSIISALIIHASQMRYRIAVLDSGDGQSVAQVREQRAQLSSKYAALYYPWVRVLDPVTRKQVSLPPSGFVAGIYARNDTMRAVYKAPANEVVNLALGFEKMLNRAQQEVLNPEGVNCFRFFEGRGYLVWGARMVTDDPEWKYVNLRRYFAYLERSIDLGTQWAVFEPNGPNLWANVTRTVENFLLNEWTNGALLGDKPEKAYFVRCDRSTMTQNDLDNGRLVCLIGVAPLRPAEFVIFRIGQWTGDAQR